MAISRKIRTLFRLIQCDDGLFNVDTCEAQNRGGDFERSHALCKILHAGWRFASLLFFSDVANMAEIAPPQRERR